MKKAKALLILAYGSPDTMDDVEAYYTDVRHGHPPEVSALKELKDRYLAIGGKTPLTAITLKQAKALEKRLGVKTFVGMKHWHPYIREAVEQIAKTGIHEIIALVLAPHFSTLSIGDYRTRLEKAITEVNPSIRLTFKEHWGDNPMFITSLCERIAQTRKQFSDSRWEAIEVVFTAHSLPIQILANGDPYKKELEKTSMLAAERLGILHWRQAFQSAGRTRDTWLGPDILQELKTIAGTKRRQVMVAPIGFTTDNLEILYDLDIQAAQVAKDLRLSFKRIPSANSSVRFIDALQSVIEPFITPGKTSKA